MGVPNCQLTTIFSAKYQLTTIFLANSQLTTNFGQLLTFTFLQRILFDHNPTFNESLNLQISSLAGCFKKINAFLVFSVCFQIKSLGKLKMTQNAVLKFVKHWLDQV